MYEKYIEFTLHLIPSMNIVDEFTQKKNCQFLYIHNMLFKVVFWTLHIACLKIIFMNKLSNKFQDHVFICSI